MLCAGGGVSQQVRDDEEQDVKCPDCRNDNLPTKWIRQVIGGTMRVRQCRNGGQRVRTREAVERLQPVGSKR